MVDTKIKNCLACQGTTYVPTRDPLKPTKLPGRPWECIGMDFWGPLPNGEYLLVMIDEYTRYPEVEFTKSTSVQLSLTGSSQHTGFLILSKLTGDLHLMAVAAMNTKCI